MPVVSPRSANHRTLAQTLQRGLLVIDALAEGPALGVSELSRRLGVPKTVVHRLLGTLRRHGYVARQKSRKYQLTWRPLAVAEALRRSTGLQVGAEPVLRDLAAMTGATATVAVLDGWHVVDVLTAPTRAGLGLDVPTGRRLPAFCTAPGKAILAFLQEDEVGVVVAATEFAARTAGTIHDPEQFARELMQVRERGYAVDNEESQRGVRGVAAPLLRDERQPLGAVGIVAPTPRLDASPPDALGEIVRVAAGTVAGALARRAGGS